MDVLIIIIELAVMCDSLTPVLVRRPLAWLARDSHDLGKYSPARERLYRFQVIAGRTGTKT
jgi:hypothetical protein